MHSDIGWVIAPPPHHLFDLLLRPVPPGRAHLERVVLKGDANVACFGGGGGGGGGEGNQQVSNL